jgi:hypothetical protein
MDASSCNSIETPPESCAGRGKLFALCGERFDEGSPLGRSHMRHLPALMYGSEQNIVIGRRIKQDQKAVARRPFFFPGYVRKRTERLATEGDSR